MRIYIYNTDMIYIYMDMCIYIYIQLFGDYPPIIGVLN